MISVTRSGSRTGAGVFFLLQVGGEGTGARGVSIGEYRGGCARFSCDPFVSGLGRLSTPGSFLLVYVFSVDRRRGASTSDSCDVLLACDRDGTTRRRSPLACFAPFPPPFPPLDLLRRVGNRTGFLARSIMFRLRALRRLASWRAVDDAGEGHGGAGVQAMGAGHRAGSEGDRQPEARTVLLVLSPIQLSDRGMLLFECARGAACGSENSRRVSPGLPSTVGVPVPWRGVPGVVACTS